MPPTFRRFDDYLPHVASDMLKSIARLWGSRGQPRKDECVAIIRRGLADPQQVRAAIESLAPHERMALSIVKWMGGAVEALPLATALRASGVALPKSRAWSRNDTQELIDPLVRRGLLLYESGRGSTYFDSFGYTGGVFGDERLLDQVALPKYAPLPIRPVAAPAETLARRPASVMMDLLAVLRAIDALGGLQLTKSGAPRAAEARKLLRALGWPAERVAVDDQALPDPIGAFTTALPRAGLLTNHGEVLATAEPVEALARESYADPIGAVLRGFIRAGEWSEQGGDAWHGYNGIYRAQGRMALSIALAALPEGDEFFSIDDLERALFDRVGDHFSLSFPPTPPYTYNKTPAEIRRAEEEWRANLRADWHKRERPWMDAALTSWLYFLGIVELGLADARPVCVRLTALGRALLRGESTVAAIEPAAGPAWRVQPNFEVLVYYDHARPDQIAFVERHAERAQAQAHVATYRLTRESIYGGLESGTQLDALLAGLSEGAGGQLPQNVAASIREWAGQRERITVYRRASLLEFPDEPARRQVLAKGINGVPVGERFILLTGVSATLPPHDRLDYSGALPAAVTATEDGTLHLTKPTRDMLLLSQLDQWAERLPGNKWRLTRASVVAAIKAGGTLTQLMAMLKDRLLRPLPPLLAVALRAWAGKPAAVELSTVTALRCADPATLAAIAASPTFAPFLRGTLAPDVLLVDTRSLPALRERLEWAGLAVGELKLEVKS